MAAEAEDCESYRTPKGADAEGEPEVGVLLKISHTNSSVLVYKGELA